MNNKTAVKFGLRGIKTDLFDILENNFEEGKDVGFGVALSFRVNSEKRLIGSSMEFKFVQNDLPFVKIKMSLHFEISEESWKTTAQLQGNEITISKDFLAHLAMITTGTLRGALFERTEGTSFNRFIVPVLNVSELVKEDGKFTITGEPVKNPVLD